MEVLITYDVATDTEAGRKRLRKVAQVCKDFGQRVQKSVFECSVNEIEYERLRERLLVIINKHKDNLRIYRLREPKERYVESYGSATTIDFDGPLIY